MNARTVGAVLLAVGCGPADGQAPPIDTDAPGWGAYDQTFGEIEPPLDTGEPEPLDRGEPFDADGDGFPGDTDCDDGDPDVHPDAADFCGDDVDDDCSGTARTCDRVWHTGSVTWRSADDMTAFCEAHTAIDGDLHIATGFADLVDAACLVEVTGDVSFDRSDGPVRTHGLGSLQAVGGDLRFDSRDLWQIDGLDQLETVGGEVSFASGRTVEAISGFDALRTVGGGLTFSALPHVETMPDFSRLETVGGAIRFDGDGCGRVERIPRFPHLRSAQDVVLACAGTERVVDGFGSLVELTGDGVTLDTAERDVELAGFGAATTLHRLLLLAPGVRVTGFGQLERVDQLGVDTNGAALDLSGLGSLAEVTDELVVEDYAPGTPLRALRHAGSVDLGRPATSDDLGWLGALETIDGDLHLWSGDFDDLSGAVRLRSVGGEFHYPSTTATQAGLPALEEIGGDVDLAYHTSVTGLPALQGLERIGGDLRLSHTRLTDLSDLSELTEVGGDIHLDDISTLTDATGLAALQTVGGSITVEDDEALTTIDLPALETVGGDLTVQVNPALASLYAGSLSTVAGDVTVALNISLAESDLSALSAVGGDLTVSRLRYLDDSTGLQALTTVGGDLTLHQLIRLEELHGLAALRGVGGDLTVSHVQKLTDVSGLHGVTSVGGDLVLTGNDWLAAADETALVDAIGGGVGGSVVRD